MKKIILLLSLTFLLTGCSSFNEEEIKVTIQKEIEELYDNLLLEDLDKVMRSFSSSSEQFYSLYEEFRDTFRLYNYNYKIEEIQFKNITKENVTASVHTLISGVDENDSYDSFFIVHEFSFTPTNDNKWKISSLNTLYDF